MSNILADREYLLLLCLINSISCSFFVKLEYMNPDQETELKCLVGSSTWLNIVHNISYATVKDISNVFLEAFKFIVMVLLCCYHVLIILKIIFKMRNWQYDLIYLNYCSLLWFIYTYVQIPLEKVWILLLLLPQLWVK